MSTRDLIRVRPRLGSEKGQATTEFALVLLPLLLLVSGIIWFGIGLNYWLDLQRIANQGARWAAVDCGPPSQAAVVCPTSGGLQGYLESQPLSNGNRPTVTICYEARSGNSGGAPVATIGDPVTVRLTLPRFQLVPLLGIRKDLNASATMRLEAEPSQGGLQSAGPCT